MSLICPNWSKTNVLWPNSNWTWSECFLVQELSRIYESGIDASRIYEDELWRKEPEKRQRLIRLICKVKNEEYDEQKQKKENIRIKVDDIKLVVKAVLDIELKMQE